LVRVSVRAPSVLIEGFLWLPQPLRVNVGIMPRPFPSRSYPSTLYNVATDSVVMVRKCGTWYLILKEGEGFGVFVEEVFTRTFKHEEQTLK
jgi:hypothetical protein